MIDSKNQNLDEFIAHVDAAGQVHSLPEHLFHVSNLAAASAIHICIHVGAPTQKLRRLWRRGAIHRALHGDGRHHFVRRYKAILPKLFENDVSSACTEGSMEVLKVIWWKHGSKAGQHSSAKAHRSLTVSPDGSIQLAALEGLQPEVIEGS